MRNISWLSTKRDPNLSSTRPSGQQNGEYQKLQIGEIEPSFMVYDAPSYPHSGTENPLFEKTYVVLRTKISLLKKYFESVGGQWNGAYGSCPHGMRNYLEVCTP